MPSTSETGHAKNVANFEDLSPFCNGYGAAYNPSKAALTITELNKLQTNAKASLQQAKTTKTSFDNATNARQLAFKDLKPLATKVVNALACIRCNRFSSCRCKNHQQKNTRCKSKWRHKNTNNTCRPKCPNTNRQNNFNQSTELP